jgi:hypothetical protein
MSKKKSSAPAKYCRIFQWIEAHDSDLAEAISQLCLEGALSAGRTAGVTFLYPKDKAYRQEIADKAWTDEADEAVKLIESLIIPDALLSAADFNRRPIGSRLGVKYAVESADSKKVVIAGDVELVQADDFQTLERRAGELAVWVVTKGRLPLTGESYSAPRSERRGKTAPATTGGSGSSARLMLAARVESEYNDCMARDGCRAFNPYLAKVVGLLNYLQARHPELLALVQPLLDYEPLITFYILLEPYKTGGDPLLPDAVLFGDGADAGDAWNGACAFTSAVAEYEAFFKGGPDASGSLFRNRAGVTAQIDSVRQQISAVGSNLRQIPMMVQNVYAVFAEKNSIGGMGPIVPEATQRALGGVKKLWMDEMRFIVHEALQNMRSQPYASANFLGIVQDFRARWPGNDYAAEILLSNAADVKTDVSPKVHLLMLLKFVNSTDFLYLPMPPEMVGGGPNGSMDPTDPTIYNRNAVALGGLRRIGGMQRSSGLSPKAMAELRVYVHAHGKLPSEVMALEAAK